MIKAGSVEGTDVSGPLLVEQLEEQICTGTSKIGSQHREIGEAGVPGHVAKFGGPCLKLERHLYGHEFAREAPPFEAQIRFSETQRGVIGLSSGGGPEPLGWGFRLPGRQAWIAELPLVIGEPHMACNDQPVLVPLVRGCLELVANDREFDGLVRLILQQHDVIVAAGWPECGAPTAQTTRYGARTTVWFVKGWVWSRRFERLTGGVFGLLFVRRLVAA